MKLEYKLLPFATQTAWRKWLEKNHSKADGVYIKFFKKASGKKTVTYAEALDEALCYGWIDGIARSIDEKSYMQKFTPRRKKSLWSTRNREHVARLIKLKKMTPAGLAEVKRAKQDGRWDAAYDGPGKSTIPADFLKALKKNKKAEKFFKTLNKTNLYSITWRLQTAIKPETRQKRMDAILSMLNKGQKFH